MHMYSVPFPQKKGVRKVRRCAYKKKVFLRVVCGEICPTTVAGLYNHKVIGRRPLLIDAYHDNIYGLDESSSLP
jgi:hypothetical protein